MELALVYGLLHGSFRKWKLLESNKGERLLQQGGEATQNACVPSILFELT